MAVDDTIEQRDETSPPAPPRARRRWVLLALILLLAFGVWNQRERWAHARAVVANSSMSAPLPPTGAAPATASPRPRIAIVIDGLGVDPAATTRAIALPPAVTLSFAT